MNTQKVSVSMRTNLFDFVEQYRAQHNIKRSQVFEKALTLLQQIELAKAYKESAKEDKIENENWEIALNDGLDK